MKETRHKGHILCDSSYIKCPKERQTDKVGSGTRTFGSPLGVVEAVPFLVGCGAASPPPAGTTKNVPRHSPLSPGAQITTSREPLRFCCPGTCQAFLLPEPPPPVPTQRTGAPGAAPAGDHGQSARGGRSPVLSPRSRGSGTGESLARLRLCCLLENYFVSVDPLFFCPVGRNTKYLRLLVFK